ncbi:putative cytochrome c oxidase copper chaperone, cysteine alpha-hairpin motif superfamily [Helianthus annuus]|nr:putative cytochrome c oxidase copper chaperone, cysteine alpha-hairpin motif superfamily [Helianthus annuus]
MFRHFFFFIIQELVIMSGLQTQDFPSALRLTKAQKDQGSTESETKPKKKICCACPDTKKLRDECIVEHGESACEKWIEAHRLCLRAEGFNV